jgi:hypothetical protein
MPGDKDKLSQLLGNDPSKPAIRRGQGVRLSIDPEQQTAAPVNERRIAVPEIKRVNRGYTLREDYVKALKRIALDDGRKLYEVMDEALAAYIQARATSSNDKGKR